jgi:nucleoside-diphosphate-sugar epimerase
MKIVVIGGTGRIGSKVVAILREKGHNVVAAAPNTGINTITGEGLKEAMEDTQVVIDLANSPSFEDKAVHCPSSAPTGHPITAIFAPRSHRRS